MNPQPIANPALRPSACSLQPSACRLRRRFSGFTLVELLVVITIIALLVGMLTAALVGARNHAKQARAQTQLRELVKAWTQYWLVYGAWPSSFTVNTPIAMTPDNLLFLQAANNSKGIAFLTVKTGTSADSGQNYLDPWGHPFYITLNNSTQVVDTAAMRISVALPNRERYQY